MAVAMYAINCMQHGTTIPAHLERYYSMEMTPSPPSVPQQHVVPDYYRELDDDAFHSDAEIQKVGLNNIKTTKFMFCILRGFDDNVYYNYTAFVITTGLYNYIFLWCLLVWP